MFGERREEQLRRVYRHHHLLVMHQQEDPPHGWKCSAAQCTGSGGADAIVVSERRAAVTDAVRLL